MVALSVPVWNLEKTQVVGVLARTIQLALEYDPAPPFDGGHPSRTAQPLVDGLKARVYDKAAADMEAAICATLAAT